MVTGQGDVYIIIFVFLFIVALFMQQLHTFISSGGAKQPPFSAPLVAYLNLKVRYQHV